MAENIYIQTRPDVPYFCLQPAWESVLTTWEGAMPGYGGFAFPGADSSFAGSHRRRSPRGRVGQTHTAVCGFRDGTMRPDPSLRGAPGSGPLPGLLAPLRAAPQQRHGSIPRPVSSRGKASLHLHLRQAGHPQPSTPRCVLRVRCSWFRRPFSPGPASPAGTGLGLGPQLPAQRTALSGAGTARVWKENARGSGRGGHPDPVKWG